MKTIVPALWALLMISCSSPQPSTIYQKLTKSIFKVEAGDSVGTAFVLNTPTGKIAISAGHVCTPSTDGYLMAEKFPNIYNEKIKILKIDKDRDLCAMEVPSDLPGLDIAKGALQAYQNLHSAGYPMGTSLAPRSGNLTGAVQNPFIPTSSTVEETTILAHPGDSGSPVVNDKNEVVGVLTMAALEIEKSFMQTRTTLRNFLTELANEPKAIPNL